MKIKSNGFPKYLLLGMLCTLLLARPVSAGPSTTMTLVEVVGGTLVAAESVNLIVRAVIALQKIGKKKPPPQTNVPPATNLIALTNTVRSETNHIKPVTNIVKLPLTNVVHPPQTNLVLKSLALTNTNMMIVMATNRGPETNLLSLKPAVLSNLTENEKQDIMLFGKDYYYLVSLAYFKVNKKEKSKEFMLHSLAIEVRVEEGTKFLKDAFKMTDEEIRTGKMRYLKSHE